MTPLPVGDDLLAPDRPRHEGELAEEPHGRQVLAVKARYTGTFLHIDLRISVDGDLSMKEADNIARRVEEGLIEKIPFTREANVIVA